MVLGHPIGAYLGILSVIYVHILQAALSMPSKKTQLTASRTHPRPIVPRPVTQGYNIVHQYMPNRPFLGSIFRYDKQNSWYEIVSHIQNACQKSRILYVFFSWLYIYSQFFWIFFLWILYIYIILDSRWHARSAGRCSWPRPTSTSTWWSIMQVISFFHYSCHLAFVSIVSDLYFFFKTKADPYPTLKKVRIPFLATK